MADRVGELAMHLVSLRAKRGLQLTRGWPDRIVMLLHEQQSIRQRCLEELRRDNSAYELAQQQDSTFFR